MHDMTAMSQGEVSAEIGAIESAYQRSGYEESQPRLDYAPYRSSLLRHPTKDLHHADPEGVELWTPCFSERDVHPLESDLTIQHHGAPIGERMVVTGRIVDGDGRPVRRATRRDLAGQRRAAATSTSAISIRRRSIPTSPASAAA